uniref:TSA: Wollemia nobilis Ref_Wollemi_Transcript_13184_1269 transcribed RNA sequence n=1 Tax=Wollemia nobilis TaxID=56998 RepID=A0A0C9S7M5_9CONI
MAEQVVGACTRVGWVGTGVMGLAMCGRVQAAGYPITVFARTTAKIEALCANGAVSANSPRAVGERSDVVFTMVSNPSDVREVILGTHGILAGLAPGGTVVDMTSSQPSLAREIFAAAAAKGCDAVDAPVSGGDWGALNGTLAILAGGRMETVVRLDPLFRCMGSATYLGPAGAGQSCKIANQITVAANIGGLSEGLVFARKAGLDEKKYLSAISGGAAGSKAIELWGERMIDRDFAPGGFAAYMVKDLGMALQEGESMGVSLPGSALHHQLYLSMMANGDGQLGSQAYITAVERLNNLN